MAESKEQILLDEDELLEAQILLNADMWAEVYLRDPIKMDRPLTLRSYQKEILRDKSQRKVLRLGRRTGKSLALCAEALYKAFTNNNREILITAAYESQVELLFEQIRRLSFDSPYLKNSVARYRQKPYEIWWKNGSVIRGRVANSSIRGQCLVKGSPVWMADGTYKLIENVKVGDEVVSISNLDGEPVVGKVVNFFNNGMKEVYHLRTTSDRRLLATGNHWIYAARSQYHEEGWAPINQLRTLENHHGEADFICTVNGVTAEPSWARVKLIQPFGMLPVFDIEIEDYHNFISFYPNTIEESGFSKSGIGNGGFLVHNSAHDLIIDEGDYIPSNTLMQDVWPIATTFRDTSVIFSSTPSGRREFFYKICTSPEQYRFKPFHVSSTQSPEWTEETEMIARRSAPTVTTFTLEYLAEFTDELDGVFRDEDLDNCMYIYDYKDLHYNAKNYYTMGVDWNESASGGVQVVILEWIRDPVQMIPYRNGLGLKTKQETTVSGKFRVFYVAQIDPAEYTNTIAVNTILDIMRRFRPNYMLFDHGHGYTNWELLRLAIKQGRSTTGKPVRGMDRYLEKMEVVDFSSTIGTIDPVTNTTMKHRAKNFIVKLTQASFENQMFAIPAVNKNGIPVEENEHGLLAQLRQYNIARIGQKGEVYESGPAGDHRLDAFVLAVYAFGKEHSSFLKYDFAVVPDSLNQSPLGPSILPSDKRTITLNRSVPEVTTHRTKDGIKVYNHGLFPKKGEPKEVPVADPGGNGLVPQKRSPLSGRLLTYRGSRSL